MHPIKAILARAGKKILTQRVMRLGYRTLLVAMSWLLVYFTAILTIKGVSLTWFGLLTVPTIALAAFLVGGPYLWWQLRDSRQVARSLEKRFPELQLSVRTALDFLEGRADHQDSPFQLPYLLQVKHKLEALDIHEPETRPWARYAILALLTNVLIWQVFEESLLKKYYNPSMSFGQTHLDLGEGSITIFEPDYTQIPGRTLPLKPGVFQAFPGSRVRFVFTVPARTEAIFLSLNQSEEPIPVEINSEGAAAYEFVLLENTELSFLLSEVDGSGRTSPYRFETRLDGVPELSFQSYTPEGPINVLDPLILEVEVKDDFGIQNLQAVVTWGENTKKVEVAVPANRRKHFLTRNQWYISDFGIEDAESFSIYLEATDNNPIGEPGVGRSPTLTYELESPNKKYDEFMELARQLLDSMTHTLGDNLETTLANTMDDRSFARSEELGKQISVGLYSSLNMTNKLLGQVRETPNLTQLDQNFLYQFRNGISSRARARTDMNLLYASMRNMDSVEFLKDLRNKHKSEELQVEDLTYDLLLQLKMWAVLDMERQKNEMESDLKDMEELLANSENMDEKELMELFDKLMSEVMKNFEEMMARAAQQMEMTVQEFMNSDAMEFSEDQFKEIREKIMEALREGDMEKARKLMEEMKAMMQEAMANMQQAMGEMSPEMQAMMAQMRELMGLLRELKTGEEKLEADTQNLKRELDQAMGGNDAKMTPGEQAEYKKATERMHELLTGLYNRMVSYKTEGMIETVINKIAELREQLSSENLTPLKYSNLRIEITQQERMLDFLSRDGMDRLQESTLRALEQTEKLQDYLDQNELMLSLEMGMKLDSALLQGERMSEQTPSRQLQEDLKPAETFHDARVELEKILDALQKMRQTLEDKRQQFMQAQQEGRHEQLAKQQADLQKMMEEFMAGAKDTFDGTQISQKLGDIGMSMRNAEQRLQSGKLEGGIQHEQDALQKIGELMEQMQQSQRPSGQRPQMMMGQRQQGFQGDPSLENFFIPESQKKAARDRMKDTIRKQLEKSLPDSYGKEIRKYYEKLMDQ